MLNLKTPKRNIRNPEKWIGRYVGHMANWRNFQYDGKWFVCEGTLKLYPVSQEGYWGNVFATYEDAVAAGYDECYGYSEDALLYMWHKAYKSGVISY